MSMQQTSDKEDIGFLFRIMFICFAIGFCAGGFAIYHAVMSWTCSKFFTSVGGF